MPLSDGHPTGGKHTGLQQYKHPLLPLHLGSYTRNQLHLETSGTVSATLARDTSKNEALHHKKADCNSATIGLTAPTPLNVGEMPASVTPYAT